MDGVKGIAATTVAQQLKSLFVFEFLKEYNELELTIRDIFEKSLPSLPPEIIQELYFYYGGKIGSYIEYETHSIQLRSLKYKSPDNFKDLSFGNIVKIFKKNHCIDAFNFSIASIQRSTIEISFYDCVTRLLNMRNKLAHEVVNLHFTNADLIEMLTREQIAAESFDVLQNYDLQKIDDMTMYIASNTVYIRHLLVKLHSIVIDST